jgi:hypothetical protein
MIDNLLYIVAGEIIHVVSGKAGVVLLKRIMGTLEMNHSAASFVRRYNEHYRSSRAHKWKS